MLNYKVYEVSTGTKKIVLNINIGYGQIGQTKIFKDGKLLKTVKNSIVNMPLGTNSALQFSRMEFKTIITNSQANTNQMSYQFSLKGGIRTLTLPTQQHTASQPGEVIRINTMIDFI